MRGLRRGVRRVRAMPTTAVAAWPSGNHGHIGPSLLGIARSDGIIMRLSIFEMLPDTGRGSDLALAQTASLRVCLGA